VEAPPPPPASPPHRTHEDQAPAGRPVEVEEAFKQSSRLLRSMCEAVETPGSGVGGGGGVGALRDQAELLLLLDGVLHPTPYTLHSSPHTLHPTPYTPHPTPYTLHPKPYTSHPTPYTLGAACGHERQGPRAVELHTRACARRRVVRAQPRGISKNMNF